MLNPMETHSLYIHVPFCLHRCGYCDFNTYAGMMHWMPDYVQAVCKELELTAAAMGQRVPVQTLFFGGGTPTLLQPEQVEQILQTARRHFEVADDAEITLEANPGTVTRASLAALRQMGVNRLSFGMQSAVREELVILERQHDSWDVLHAVEWARLAGFDNLSLDLIFGLPQQTLKSWVRSMEFALRLHPQHLSLYSLTVEEGTPLFRWVGRGLLEVPDDDQAADMYEAAMDGLEQAGYVQYEISNWAARRSKDGLWTCRHNLQYWYDQPYFGIGAGAHGYIQGQRTVNAAGIVAYIQRIQRARAGDYRFSPANEQVNQVDRLTEIGEMMMVGLRLTQEGVSVARFIERFGQPLEVVFPKEIAHLTSLGLLEWTGVAEPHLRLTRRGRLLGNQVFSQFV